MSSIINGLAFIELARWTPSTTPRSRSCASRATHLVAGSPVTRTPKVLEALAAGLWILKPSWIYACVEAGKQVPEATHEWTEADATEGATHTIDLGAPR